MKSEQKKQRTMLQQIGSMAATLILMLSVIILVITAITVIQAKNDPRNAFLLGYRPAIVETGSMTPYMLEDSVAILKKTDYAQLKPGDVVTYDLNGQFISHRVIDLSAHQAIVKGDANAVADLTPVTTRNFVGTVVYRMNWTSPIVASFKTDPQAALIHYVAFPLIAVMLIWFIVAMLIRFLRAGKQESDTPLSQPQPQPQQGTPTPLAAEPQERIGLITGKSNA